MVLFKDLNDKAINVLEKNFGHDKAVEVEYRHSSKDLVVDNNVSLKGPSGGLDCWTSVKYMNPTSLTDVKLMGSGSATVDARWFLGNVVIGCKAESKPNKVSEDSTLSCDLSSELKSNPLHMKFSYLPFTKSCNLSAVASQEFSCGTTRVGGEISTDKNVKNASYSMGASFSYGETMKNWSSPSSAGRRDKEKSGQCVWVASVKSAAHGKSPMGMLLGHLHLNGTLGAIPAQYAAEVQHILSDRTTNLALAGQFCLNKQRGTCVRLRIPHDFKNVVISLGQNVGPVKATVGAEINTSKLGGISLVKYGVKLSMLNQQ